MNDPNAPDSAESAWARGLAGGGVSWLARAVRLAPGDPRIVLDLARVRLGGGLADVRLAVEALEGLAGRHDVLAVWVALAMGRQILGDVAGAAATLDEVLARHCVPEEAGFAALAGRVAAAAGYGGFCGVLASGRRVVVGEGRRLGAPDMAVLGRVEGLVRATEEGLGGWASRKAAQETPPRLMLVDAAGIRRAVKFGEVLAADEHAPFLNRYGFTLTHRQLRGLMPPFALRGADGAHLLGSPVDPSVLAIAPVPASNRGKPVTRLPPRRKLAIVIPLYRGLAESQACLASLLAALPVPKPRVILVDDATPEPALAAWASEMAARHRLTLCRHTENLGFPAAVNTGLAAAGMRDVLLLNSDTLIPPGAIEALREAAYANADTGTVTPLSNEATILSYPNPRGGNKAPSLAETARLHAIAQKGNGRRTAEIPTGIGFCMYIRQDCLAATGLFRPEIFAQGYGEENDFCMRARHLGYTHRAALGVYVAHIGGVSFRAAARGLTARNLELLNRLYPGYHALVMAHIGADPLAPARARLDALRLRAAQSGRDSMLLISHSHGGGVARQVAAQMKEFRADGLRPLLLTTQFPQDPATPYPWPALLCEGEAADYPNLAFTLPEQQPALLRLLKSLRIRRVILHHALGHHPAIRNLAAALGLKQEIVIHDYAAFCRRVNLLTRPVENAKPRYCGEPDANACITCCTRHEEEIFEDLAAPQLLRRSAAEFKAAAAITAPSADAARRIARHFPGIQPRITPWEDDSLPQRLTPPSAGPRRIVTIGGIGPSKGFDILLDCARDASARNLPLKFLVAGSSADDARLLEAGVFVTGHYAEGEASCLIATLKPDLAFLPSIWPETWCFAVSEAWRAGLYAVSFDLGAQAERIKATRRGATIPLGLPASRINDFLSRWTP